MTIKHQSCRNNDPFPFQLTISIPGLAHTTMVLCSQVCIGMSDTKYTRNPFANSAVCENAKKAVG